MTIYSKEKIIYKDNDTEVFLKRNILSFCQNSIIKTVKLPLPFYLKPFLYFNLFLRLFRIDIRCFDRIGDNYYFFFKNCLYSVKKSKAALMLNQIRIFKMSSPLYFTKGFDKKSILFGDYTNDGKNNKVNVYSISENDEIKTLFSFNPGIVKHIHNIVPSYDNNFYWILTGDSDLESGIWKLDKDNNIDLFIGPSQFFRSCFMCETKDNLYYLTDSPLVDNYINVVDKASKNIIHKTPISGPCIFALFDGKNIVFSTSVEPNPNKKRVLNNYKKSETIKDRFVHIYKYNLKSNELRELISIKKDFHNMKLFGFGNANVFSNNNTILFTPTGVKKYSFKTIEIDYE